MNNNLNKNMFWNLVGSLSYVFASMILLVIVIRLNSDVEAGIFSIAFSISSFLLCIGNYATRTYQVTENTLSDKSFLYHRHFVVIIMLFSAFLYGIFSSYSMYRLGVLMLFMIYKVMEAYSEVNYAIIQKNNELYKVGKSLFLKAFLGVLAFFLVDILTNNLVYSIISLITITLFIILIYDLNIVKSYNLKKEKFNISNVSQIFKKGFNPFIFSFLGLYMMSAPRFVIDQVLEVEVQALFGMIMMPATIMILLSQFLVQPYLNILKEYNINKDYTNFFKTVNSILKKILVISIISTVIMYLFGTNILNAIYGVNVDIYKNSITYIIIGAALYGAVSIISASLTTLRKLKEQTIIYTISSIITFIITIYFVNEYQLVGAIYAYIISMTILFICYYIYYITQLKKN